MSIINFTYSKWLPNFFIILKQLTFKGKKILKLLIKISRIFKILFMVIKFFKLTFLFELKLLLNIKKYWIFYDIIRHFPYSKQMDLVCEIITSTTQTPQRNSLGHSGELISNEWVKYNIFPVTITELSKINEFN